MAIVSASDPIYVAAKKMKEFRVNSVVVTSGGKPQGILTWVYLLIFRIYFLSVRNIKNFLIYFPGQRMF